MLAGAVLALDGGDLQMRRGHLGLHEELAPCGADADNRGRIEVERASGRAGRAAARRGIWMENSEGVLHGSNEPGLELALVAG